MKIVFCIQMVMILFIACSPRSPEQHTLTGLIDGTEIDVSSKVPGRIKSITVREGDRVTENQHLVTIESEEIAAKIEQVEAAIEASKAKLRLAEKGAREEEKQAAAQGVEAARHQMETAKKMYDRMVELKTKETIPQAKLDEAELSYNMAKDQLAIAEARFTMVKNGARTEEIEALRALVKQGVGTLSEIESYRKETQQNSPINGVVTKLILHKGELAATGYPIVTILDTNDLWAVFTVREDMLANIKTGQKVALEIPALKKKVPFTLFNIAALGDFATWRATSEKNAFDLKSFEIKLRSDEKIEELKPGMTVRWSF